jgi:hypothetical protein
MEKYLRLFAALERIFGKGYVSRLMGKQSNVITLPDKQARKFLDTELNVMEASEGAVKKGVQDLNNLVSDTKRLSTLNDQELLTITNNAERLAVKVNPPAPPPAPTADVLSITTKVNKNKDPNVLIDEYNKNQTRLRLTDDEGGTAISYDEFRKLQSRNNEIEKTLESLNVKPALDEVKPEGIVIPFTKKTEDFATGGRVGMAGGGILKLAMKFFNDNNPVSAYKKYLKYVKETAQKDPAKLAPEVGGIVVGSELIHRGLRRKLKEVKEKNNENDSENLETDNRTEKAGGGVSQGLDYLTGIERQGYANGDYAIQAGIKNYLGKQKTATVPIKWKSGKDHPDTELAYITKPEKDLLLKLDMHNSMPDGEPNIGPGGIISLNSGGSGDVGPDSAGPSDTGGELSYTDYSDADIGPMGLVDEATAKANLQSVVDNMKAKMTKDMDPSQKYAFNLSINNPFTSTFGKIGNSVLSPIGTILSSFSYNPDFAGDRKYTDYGNTQSDEYGSDGSDGGGGDGRTFIPSFDTTLLTPDLAKNRDYRLYQGANNPFYSMQAAPSGGIKNLYTEFQTGGRVGYSMGTLIKRTLLTAETLSELKPEYLKKLRRLEGYLGSINMDSKGGEQAVKKTMDKINTLKQEYKLLEKDLSEKKQLNEFDITNRTNNAKGGILKVAQKLIKKPKKYKFTGEESLNDLYELERQGKITREDMNVYSPRYLEYLDAQIINKEKLYTPKEWEKTPEVLKNKMRGRIDPDWEEANFGEEFNWDQARSIEMKQQKQLQDFDITGRKKNAKGGLNYLMGL